MNQSKTYAVKVTRYSSMVSTTSTTTVWQGSIDYLNTRVFGYTLECGHSWNSKIPRYPKTISALVNALNKSAKETNDYRNRYSVATKEDIATAIENKRLQTENLK